MSYDELIHEITESFADVPSPGDQIICHECEECFQLRDSLLGRKPHDLSDDWVKKNFDQLPLLSDEAKQFYISAYLRVGAGEPNSLVSEFILYALASDFRWQPNSGYTPRQQRALLGFLNYIEPHTGEYDRDTFTQARKLWDTVAQSPR